MNLVTGYYLLRAGYAVLFVDRSQDPRLGGAFQDFGATHGGEDARVFTLRENCYGFKASQEFPFFQQEKAYVQNRLSEEDWIWLRKFQQTSSELKRSFNQDILSLNQESLPLWRDLLREEKLAWDVDLRNNVLQLYTNLEDWQANHVLEERCGGLLRVLSRKALQSFYGFLRKDLRFVGGLEVAGFSLKIHQLAKNLLNYLEDYGAQYLWGEEVVRFEYKNQQVGGLMLLRGGVVRGAHYVISLGAYGGDFLSDLHLKQTLSGIFGVWIRVLLRAQEHNRPPVKIVQTDPGFVNVIPGKDEQGQSILRIGGGFEYLGYDFKRMKTAQKELLFAKLEKIAAIFFPKEYAFSLASGYLQKHKRYCIRPCTASGLGLYEVQKYQNGTVILTGGHSSGGFVQAPVVGQAVLQSLSDQTPHRMGLLYQAK